MSRAKIVAGLTSKQFARMPLGRIVAAIAGAEVELRDGFTRAVQAQAWDTARDYLREIASREARARAEDEAGTLIDVNNRINVDDLAGIL